MSNAGLIAEKDMIFARTLKSDPFASMSGPPCSLSGLGPADESPDRKTVVFEGDGSGTYTPQTLWTMARKKVDVTIVVMKNDSYGILNIELARVREGDPHRKCPRC
jgi:thiamine pyrophosphate-dependent acetolactate synthase large subunit-like protein